MKVFVVSADTWFDGYGSEIDLFGIFSDRNKAEDRKRELKERHGYSAQIDEVWVDRNSKIYLGGYVE